MKKLVNFCFKFVKALVNVVSNALNFCFSNEITMAFLSSFVEENVKPLDLFELFSHEEPKPTQSFKEPEAKKEVIKEVEKIEVKQEVKENKEREAKIMMVD